MARKSDLNMHSLARTIAHHVLRTASPCKKYLNIHQHRPARLLCADSQHDLYAPAAIVEAILSRLPPEKVSIQQQETAYDDVSVKTEVQLIRTYQKLYQIQVHQAFSAGIYSRIKTQLREISNEWKQPHRDPSQQNVCQFCLLENHTTTEICLRKIRKRFRAKHNNVKGITAADVVAFQRVQAFKKLLSVQLQLMMM